MHGHGSTIVVVAAGKADPRIVPLLPAGAAVVAADSGVDAALALGLRVAVAVGDFDSVTPEGLAAAEAGGARVERHPAAKDQTDLELALDTALGLDPGRLLVVGSGGGRLDHLAGGLLLLAHERYAGVTVDALLGEAAVHVVRGERVLEGEPGDLLSLLPVHGPAVGVVTEGLLYPLRRETLEPGSTRGVSNVFSQPSARVSLERGVLLAIRPGPDERTH